MLPLKLFSAPPGSRFDHCAVDLDNLTIYLAITNPTAICRLCRSYARRVHSRYTRRLADLPCLGRAVRLQVAVRRFSCPRPDGPRRIFAERLPGFAEPHARTTGRLGRAHESIGCALGGDAGSRLTARLSITTSPDTLLRRVKRLDDDSAPPPRFVGIYDWAWRKGEREDTIVVDLERVDVVDLLPDRDPETVKEWRGEHPGVELVSRDRGSEYIHAAAEAAPNAQQVADRWHLLKNLREALERLFERESGTIAEALKPTEPASESVIVEPEAPAGEERPTTETPGPPPPGDPAAATPRQEARQARRRRRVERFERVHELKRQGRSIRGIAGKLACLARP